MRSIGYLVCLLLHLLFDRITGTLNTIQFGKKQSDQRYNNQSLFILIRKRGICPCATLPPSHYPHLQLCCIKPTRLSCKLFSAQTKLLKKAYYRKWYFDQKNSKEEAVSFSRKLSANSFYRASWKHRKCWFRKGFRLDKTEVLLAMYGKKSHFYVTKDADLLKCD